MSKNKIHYSQRSGIVTAIGELPGSNSYIEVDDASDALDAINAGKTVSVVDGEIRIHESRAKKWSDVRQHRDGLLKQSDINLMKQADLEIISGTQDPETRSRLAEYRQALRDITTQPDPFNILWPSLEPEESL